LKFVLKAGVGQPQQLSSLCGVTGHMVKSAGDQFPLHLWKAFAVKIAGPVLQLGSQVVLPACGRVARLLYLCQCLRVIFLVITAFRSTLWSSRRFAGQWYDRSAILASGEMMGGWR
jgi:hypothetical protein